MRTQAILALTLLAGCGSSTGAASTTSSSSSSSSGSSGGSSGGSTGGSTGGSRTDGAYLPADETWADGTQLSGTVTIAAGHVVEIAPGATVTCAAGTQITVAGTLEAASDASPAALVGTSWTGLSVAWGGTLRLSGVDVRGAGVGLEVLSGGQARYDHGTLHATVPLRVAAHGQLTTAHAVMVAGDNSTVAGDLTASYLDYDKGISEGITTTDPSATLSVEDSALHGGGGLGDFIVSNDSARIRVAYTTIAGAHCGFHFNRAQHYEIDHVTDSTNVWGAMLYNGAPGPHSITSSNFEDSSYDLDQTRTNVAVTIDGNYLPSTHRLLSSSATVTHPAAAPVADAHPR